MSCRHSNWRRLLEKKKIGRKEEWRRHKRRRQRNRNKDSEAQGKIEAQAEETTDYIRVGTQDDRKQLLFRLTIV
jgi:hypothetical protein